MRRHRLGLAALVPMFALALFGCQRTMVDAQLSAVRDAADRLDTVGDYEIARTMAYSALAQLEGMYVLAPDNGDALFLLTQGWAAVSLTFLQDDYEEAEQGGDKAQTAASGLSMRRGASRAVFYGEALMDSLGPGFLESTKQATTLEAWLAEYASDPELAEDVLAVGAAWLARIAAGRDDPAKVGELYIAVTLVRHSVALDERVAHGMGHTILGAYHAGHGLGDLKKAKRHLDRAMGLSDGRYLPTKLVLAQRYYCTKGDRDAYRRTLRDIAHAGDPLPEARLQNVVAKRRARRYLGDSYWQEECAFRL